MKSHHIATLSDVPPCLRRKPGKKITAVKVAMFLIILFVLMFIVAEAQGAPAPAQEPVIVYKGDNYGVESFCRMAIRDKQALGEPVTGDLATLCL